MITDLERTGGLPSALRRNKSARVGPPTPRAPTRRKSRRESPSHIRLAIGLLRKVNMACSFDRPLPDRCLPGRLRRRGELLPKRLSRAQFSYSSYPPGRRLVTAQTVTVWRKALDVP